MHVHPNVGSRHKPRQRGTIPPPDLSVHQHPISTKQYWLPTKQVEVFFNTIAQWVDVGVPGGVIFGKPQLGKTWAEKYTIRHLCEKLGRIFPIYMHCCPDSNRALGHSVITENRWYSDLLSSVGHDLVESGKASTKFRRLVNFMIEQASAMGTNIVLLFVDEAQRLQVPHYDWLMAINNELAKRGFTLITALVGQPQLEARRADLRSEGELQIIGRFMSVTTTFEGLQSVEDFKSTLDLYDTFERYPLESEWTFTRFFFPYSFENGFRLANGAEAVWDGYAETCRNNGLPKFAEIGMGDFSRFVHCIYKLNAGEDDDDFELTPERIQDAIDYSGYVSRVRSSTGPATEN